MAAKSTTVKELFEAGAHLGYSKTRRHPSMKSFIFGAKNHVEIIDLDKTAELLEKAEEFVTDLAKKGKQLMFVGSKNEVRETVKAGAEKVNQPYMVERWIGGTLTNFKQVSKRAARLVDLRDKEAKGGLEMYTKKERGKIGKEIKDLTRFFNGITDMPSVPGALFIVDSKADETAVLEAKNLNIPVISISSSDCDVSKVDYPIVANDSSQKSVSYFVDRIVAAYEKGKVKA